MHCWAIGLCQILAAKGGKGIPPTCGGLLQERRQGRISRTSRDGWEQTCQFVVCADMSGTV